MAAHICTWSIAPVGSCTGWLTPAVAEQKESLTGEQEICVLSVAAVMDLGYPVAISSHVAPKSSTKQQPVTELCLFRGAGIRAAHLCWWYWRLMSHMDVLGKMQGWMCQEDNDDNSGVWDVQDFPFHFLLNWRCFPSAHFLLPVMPRAPTFPNIFPSVPTFTKICIAIISPNPFSPHTLSLSLFSLVHMNASQFTVPSNQLENYCPTSKYKMLPSQYILHIYLLREFLKVICLGRMLDCLKLTFLI